MRISHIIPVLAATLTPAVWATTLQQMTLDQMIAQSTSVVRVKVTGSSTGVVGRDIYTYYQLQTIETLKASPSPQSTVAVPGGISGGLRQMVAGAPTLNAGQEYVLFLWTSKSGMTQVMGLSQGLFLVMQDENGNTVLVRPAATNLVLNQAGNVVNDQGISMTLAALRTEVQKVAGQ
jgi:hypothetical protein